MEQPKDNQHREPCKSLSAWVQWGYLWGFLKFMPRPRPRLTGWGTVVKLSPDENRVLSTSAAATHLAALTWTVALTCPFILRLHPITKLHQNVLGWGPGSVVFKVPIWFHCTLKFGNLPPSSIKFKIQWRCFFKGQQEGKDYVILILLDYMKKRLSSFNSVNWNSLQHEFKY